MNGTLNFKMPAADWWRGVLDRFGLFRRSPLVALHQRRETRAQITEDLVTRADPQLRARYLDAVQASKVARVAVTECAYQVNEALHIPPPTLAALAEQRERLKEERHRLPLLEAEAQRAGDAMAQASAAIDMAIERLGVPRTDAARAHIAEADQVAVQLPREAREAYQDIELAKSDAKHQIRRIG